MRLGVDAGEARGDPAAEEVDDLRVGPAPVVGIGRQPRAVEPRLDPAVGIVERVEPVAALGAELDQRGLSAVEPEVADGLAGRDDGQVGDEATNPRAGGDDDRVGVERVEPVDARVLDEPRAAAERALEEGAVRQVGADDAGVRLEERGAAKPGTRSPRSARRTPRARPASSPFPAARARRARSARAASRRCRPRARASPRATPARAAPTRAPGRPAGRCARCRGSSPMRGRAGTARRASPRRRRRRARRPRRRR